MGKLHYNETDERLCEHNSIKRIASITKIFTAVAIMKFVEDGLIGDNQQVREILKEFDTDMYKTIEIKHLLNHNPVLLLMTARILSRISFHCGN